MSKKCGRRATVAHRYFSHISDTDDAKCLIAKEDGSLCNVIVKSGNRHGNNLKIHLSNYHSDIRKIVDNEEAKEKKLKPASSINSNQSIMTAFTTKKPYVAGSIEDKKITEALTFFFGGTNCPKSIIEHPLFINLLKILNSQYTTPGRKKITKSISEYRKILDQKLKLALQSAKRVTVVLDLWSKLDMTPFIGVTAHFYNRFDKRRYHVTLGLKNMPHPHTAMAIDNKLNEILFYWDLDKEKVFKILTDNASNMIKAFATDQSLESANENENENSGSFFDNQNMESIAFIDLTEESDDEYEPDEEFCPDPNLEATFIDDNDLDGDIAEFDFLHNQQKDFLEQKHLCCMVHSLQLIVRRFLNEKSISKLVCRSSALVATFRKSSVITERLKMLTNGRILPRYCPTRWSSFYNMLDRLLELQEEVSIVCQEKSIDGMGSKWEKLKRVRNILEPYAMSTLDLEAYESTTLSLVVPSIKHLINHAEKMKEQGKYLAELEQMKNDLKDRFDHVLNVNSSAFDPTYIIATALDPRYKDRLDHDQLAMAKSRLLYELARINRNSENEVEHARIDEAAASMENGEPKSKRFHLVPIIHQATLAIDEGVSPEQGEINRYFTDFTKMDEDNDPLMDYWKGQKTYPLIADLAVDYLVTPCSSSSAESMFSHAGFLSSGMRSRMSPENLESQVIIKTNFFALK